MGQKNGRYIWKKIPDYPQAELGCLTYYLSGARPQWWVAEWFRARERKASLASWSTSRIALFTIQRQGLHWSQYFSHLMAKPTKWPVRPAKTQISLGICPVWSESLLCAQLVAMDPNSSGGQQRLRSDWANAQADLSLRWTHMPFVGFVMRWLISGYQKVELCQCAFRHGSYM